MSDRIRDIEDGRRNGKAEDALPLQGGPSSPTSAGGTQKRDHAARPSASSQGETANAARKEAEADGKGSTTARPAPAKRSAAAGFRAAISRALSIAPAAEPGPTLKPDQINELRALALENPTSEDVSEELSITLGLAQRLRVKPCVVDSGYDRLRFIFDCLLDDPPKLILARDERLRLQVEIYQQSGWVSRTLARISAGSPVALVLTALGASLIIWAGVFWLVRLLSGLTQPLPIFFMDGKAFAITAFAALIGGIVSIATRLREFSRVRDLDPFAMFWTALLKPLVGVVLALFILATLAGDVVSLGFLGADPLGLAGTQPVAQKSWYILWVLGFLAGFSERFAWDFVDRAQGVASGGTSAPKLS
jgi:hypothetical protein